MTKEEIKELIADAIDNAIKKERKRIENKISYLRVFSTELINSNHDEYESAYYISDDNMRTFVDSLSDVFGDY